MSRILFAGTPEIALPTLRVLAAAPGLTLGVLTNPDASSGRSRELHPSPVKALGQSLGLEVFSPAKLDGDFRAQMEGRWDLLLSFAYGKIFGPKFLALFPRGGMNIHPSLLPRWRGPSPLNAALIAGDSRSGLSIQTLALEMDSGDLIYQETWELNGRETAESLGEKAALRASEVIVSVVQEYLSGQAVLRPQSTQGITYCHLLKKEDGLIDWNLSAKEIEWKIRGLNPWPGAFTSLQGQKLTLWEAGVVEKNASEALPGTIIDLDKKEGILVQTAQGLLAVRQLQLASKKSMDHRSFINGFPGLPGLRLGE